MANNVWTICGSDSSCNTGIQADLLNINSLGATGRCVVSTITALCPQSRCYSEAVSSEMLINQLDCLAAESPACVIKIGRLATIEQLEIVAGKLADYKRDWAVSPFIIYNPLAIIGEAENPVESALIAAIKRNLLPLIDLLCVNSSTLLALSGHVLISGESFRPAAQQLISLGCKSVLITGGHFSLLDNLVLDYWSDGQREIALTSARLADISTLGRASTLCCALAAAIAQEYIIEDALVIAKAYLNQQLKAEQRRLQEKGEGWPSCCEDFPQVVFPESKAGYALDLEGSLQAGCVFAACDTAQLGLYPVLDSVAWLQKVLKLGVKTLQLRIKDKPLAEVEQEIIAAVELARKYQARLFINDYWQLAIKHRAYGVHLGQQDLQSADLALIADAGLRLGISTHGYYELLCAKQLQPSYIALGHIFATQTKQMPSLPQGITRLQKYLALLQGIPGVAIGGINLQRAAAVWATGVGSIAVVSAITEAEDLPAVIESLSR